jgi:hypothetical protein
MAIEVVRFGPGTLTLGTTPGTDFSCQVQSMGVNVDKDEGDPVKTLCGDSAPGAINYTYSLAGTVLQDFAATAGLAQYTWTNAGTPQEFHFTPSTAAVTSITGSVIIDPVSLGSSDAEFGDVLTSDVEWSCVGTPDVTWPV